MPPIFTRLLATILIAPLLSLAEGFVVTVLPGKILCIRMDRRAKMHVGAGVSGVLAEQVYVHDQIAMAIGTHFIGHVIELSNGPKSQRVKAIMDGDFTPPHEALVQFDFVIATNGTWLPIRTKAAFCIPGERDILAGAMERDSILAPFREPDKLQRVGDALMSKLPYHPQHVSSGDVFHAELESALEVYSQGPARAEHDAMLVIQLLVPLDTQIAEIDQPIDAVVSAPYFEEDGRLLLPEGTRVTGRVTEAQSAGMFVHSGKLRFHVSSARLPDGSTIALNAGVAGIESSGGDRMKVDAEGRLSTSNSKVDMGIAVVKVITPTRAGLDPSVEKTGLARAGAGMSGFGVLGSAIAQAGPTTATGFGAYGAAKAIYWSFIGPGKNVNLPVGTRIQMKLDRVD